MFIPGCCVLCLCVCLPLFMLNKYKDLKLAVCFKVLGTLCAFCLALVAAIRLDRLAWLCSAALLVFAAADFCLEYNAVLGATLFGLGHFCMIIWSLSRYTISVTHLISIVLLGLVLAFLVYKLRSAIGKKTLIPVLMYGVCLSIMCGCCIAGGLSPEAFNTSGWLMAAGGALFFVSDCLIALRTFGKSPVWISWGVMITYYCALLCFGISCLV